MSKSLRVLVVEDDETDALLILREIRKCGFDPVSERVYDRASMIAALDRQGRGIRPGFGQSRDACWTPKGRTGPPRERGEILGAGREHPGHYFCPSGGPVLLRQPRGRTNPGLFAGRTLADEFLASDPAGFSR